MILVMENQALQLLRGRRACTKTYQSKLNPTWTKELPFIGPGAGDVYRYMSINYTREETLLTHRKRISLRLQENFFVCAASYLIKWCPLKEELLLHATWLDFEHTLVS